MDPGTIIILDYIGGNCPVQAEGTINGRWFYFRARGARWSLEIHPTAANNFLNWPHDDKEWRYEEPWGDGPYAAGWMPVEAAREMIFKAAQLYVAAEGTST